MTVQKKAYAIAYLREVDFGAEIIERIDETLAPYGGRFFVRGGELRATAGARRQRPAR